MICTLCTSMHVQNKMSLKSNRNTSQQFVLPTVTKLKSTATIKPLYISLIQAGDGQAKFKLVIIKPM